MNEPINQPVNQPVNDNGRRFDSGKLFWGLALLGAGILFLLDQLGVAGIHFAIGDYWPIFIVLLGVSRLFRRPASGLSLIAIGTWLQMVQLNSFGLTWESSWPMLLILLGTGMVLRAVFDTARGRGRNKNNGGAP